MNRDPGVPGTDEASTQRPIGVLSRPTVDGFACEVVVGRDAAATHHSVSVSQAELARLAPGHYDPERLVTASFELLLAHEPREAILPRFAISVIERYFPGYEADIRTRMAAMHGTEVNES